MHEKWRDHQEGKEGRGRKEMKGITVKCIEEYEKKTGGREGESKG